MSCASSSAALSIREYIKAKPIVPVFEVYRAACISADLCRFQACRNFSSSGLTIRSCEPPASVAGESVTPGAHVGLLVGGRIARFVRRPSPPCFCRVTGGLFALSFGHSAPAGFAALHLVFGLECMAALWTFHCSTHWLRSMSPFMASLTLHASVPLPSR